MKRTLLDTLLASCLALAVAVFPAAIAGPAFGAEDGTGIKVGQRFTVPILVSGPGSQKQVNGRAVVAADKTLTILFPSADGLSVEELVYTLTRQDVQPGPGPDPQPGPKPDPKPDPKPVPTPSKLFVVICYDSDALDNGTGPQAGILTSPQVRGYLDSHCERIKERLPGPGGKEVDRPAWRFLSKTAEADKLPKQLQTWLADAKGRKLPNITISSQGGRDVYRGDLPADAAATLKLLKQFGGP